MPLVIPPGFAQAGIILNLTGDPEPMLMTFGVDLSQAAGNLYEVMRRIAEAYAQNVQPEMSSFYTASGVRFLVGQDGEAPQTVEVPFTGPLTGLRNDTPAPQNCAILVHKFTNEGGRRGKGRLYMPGPAESFISPTGLLTDAYRADLSAAWQGFVDYLTAGSVGVDAAMVLLHSSGVSATPPPSLVAAMQADQLIATQRRRLRP